MRLGEELRTRHYIDEGGRICGQSTGDGWQLREERQRRQAARQNPASATTPLVGVLAPLFPSPREPGPVILSFGRCSTFVRRSSAPVSRRRWPALCLAAAARGLPDLTSSCNSLLPLSLEPQQCRSSRPPLLTTACAPPTAFERRRLPPASPAHRHKSVPAPSRPLLHARRQLLPPSSLPECRPISPSPSSVPPVDGSFENLQKVRKAGVKCPFCAKSLSLMNGRSIMPAQLVLMQFC